MKIRKVFLWCLPFLFVGVLIFSMILQTQEKNYHNARQKGWTYYEGKDGAAHQFGPKTGRLGDMVIDDSGRIWAAPGCYGLFGLHTFDGIEWSSRDGLYRDLALSPQGQVWALKCSTNYRDDKGQRWDVTETQLEVYDGQEWTIYGMGDLGIPYTPQDDPEITQVEVDTRGNIWVAIKHKWEYEVFQVMLQQENNQTKFSLGEKRSFGEAIVNSLDTDDQGRVWVAVDGRGIFVYDHEEWKPIRDSGVNLEKIVRIIFDNQGRPWVATACGGIMRYEKNEWVTIVKEDTEDDSCGNMGYDNKQVRNIEGFTFDNQERIWAWNNDGIQLLNGDTWTTLTSENSGLVGTGFFGIVIDDQDQIWIGRSAFPYGGEISMAYMTDVSPISEEIVVQFNSISPTIEYFSAGGMTWFLASIIVILWITAYFNVLNGVLVAVILGFLPIFLFGPPMIHIHGGTVDDYIINPGVVGTYLGVLLGIINRKRPVTLAIIGVILGSAISSLLFILISAVTG